METRPDWRLPRGVSRSLWEYTQEPAIAQGYDLSISNSGLTAFDARFLQDHLKSPGRMVDLGCGTGRHAVDFASRGFEVLGVDLSTAMLHEARTKSLRGERSIGLLCANLCELDGLKDASFDYALLMYATLGMIPNVQDRSSVLKAVYRLLRPGGKLVLHVHNLWFNLFDPQGRRWLISDRIRHWLNGQAGGNRIVHDRGIPNFQMHVFSSGELRDLLCHAQFHIEVWQPLNATASGPLANAWCFGNLRANGWLVVVGK